MREAPPLDSDRSQNFGGYARALGKFPSMVGIPDSQYNRLVPYATIEMRKPGEAAWDYVGRFTAPDNEIGELRALLEDREPLEVLSSLPRGLIWDALDAIREMGCLARVQFHDD